MRAVLLITLMLIPSVCSPATAQDRPPTPCGLLHKEWKAEVKQADEETSLTRADRRRQKQEINARYTPRFLHLAQAHVDDELWVSCLIWMSVEGVAGPDFDAMFDLLGENASKLGKETFQLQLLMSEFIKLRSERIDPALSEVAENHPDSNLRGAALYALAARTKQLAEQTGDAEGCAKAEKLLERVTAEYPKVHTYRGENAENATELLEVLRSPVGISKTAPHTQGVTISGTKFDLNDAIRGKVAVISFSGHWCGPCVAMHPVQKKITSQFPAESVVVVEMNSDPNDSLDKVREKIASEGLDWIVVSDGRSGPISKQWHISAWPTYFLVDSSGIIRRRVSGNVGEKVIDWVEDLRRESE